MPRTRYPKPRLLHRDPHLLLKDHRLLLKALPLLLTLLICRYKPLCAAHTPTHSALKRPQLLFTAPTCCSKPMSNIRSASSNTKNVTRLSVHAFMRMRSSMRPGVVTAASHPALRPLTCSCM
eukprot:352233-Chlamydomonas_euryale.AAC.4